MEKIRIERVHQLEPVLELNLPAQEVISVYNPNREKSFSANYLESGSKELIDFLQNLINGKGFPVSVNRGISGLQITPPIGYAFDISTREKDRIIIILSKCTGIFYAISK
jgi:hypothetical protein